MDIEFLSSSLRQGLVIGVVLALLLSGVLVLLRRRRVAALTLAASVLIAFVLVVEKLAPSIVRATAPEALDFNEYRWIFLSPWGKGLLVLALVSSAITLVLTALATRRVRSPWRWSWIVGLRGAALMVALVLFLEPAVELRLVSREPNHIAILVDDSQSMELSDHHGESSRRQRVLALLGKSASALDTWEHSHIVDVYTFSDDLLQSERSRIAREPSEGKATLLRQALEKVRKKYKEDQLAGIVVISDGTVTGDLAKIGVGEFSDFAKALHAPIHTVWAARPGLKDVSVANVRADDFAFVRTATRIEVVIHSTGYEKHRVPVTLFGEGKAMRRKWVEVGPGDSSVSLVFEFTPPHVGKFVYKISIPVDPDEAVTQNNSAWFVVRVIRDKIRVLQVAGQPSWDVRSVRRMLKQNPNVDLISFLILRTPNNIRMAPNSELSLIPFPTRELFESELPSFDLVILQNFNYAPYEVRRYLENIRSYVHEGGALVMLGGPLAFGSGAYAGTPVAKALPVILPSDKEPASELIDSEEFQAQLTEAGAAHPVTALRYEAQDNRALWKTLPALEGVNKVLQAKRGAVVLATHPTLRDKSKKPMPVIVVGDYGKGRTLVVTTDSLWKWDFAAATKTNADGRHYLKFWDNAIRWLIQDPELRYLHIRSDKNSYGLGDSVRLHVRLQDQDYSPLADTEVKLTLYRGFDPKALEQVEERSSKTDPEGKAVHEIGRLAAGVYRVKAEARVRERLVTSNDIFLVRQASTEHRKPAGSEAVLKMASAFSGGTYLGAIDELPSDLSFTAPKLVRVNRRQDVALWSLPWLLALALLFLGVEWLLRQRSGSL